MIIIFLLFLPFFHFFFEFNISQLILLSQRCLLGWHWGSVVTCIDIHMLCQFDGALLASQKQITNFSKGLEAQKGWAKPKNR